MKKIVALFAAASTVAVAAPAMAQVNPTFTGPRVEALGVYPSMLPLAAQAFVLVVAVAGYLWNTRGTPLTFENELCHNRTMTSPRPCSAPQMTKFQLAPCQRPPMIIVTTRLL